MTFVRLSVLAGCGAVILVALALRAPAQDELDSLKVCPDTQKLIFENAFVRVIEDVIPPGVAEPKHRHPRGVVIALSDADVETRSYPDGKPTRAHSVAGTARWNEPMIHEARNVGTAPSRYIRIDVK